MRNRTPILRRTQPGSTASRRSPWRRFCVWLLTAVLICVPCSFSQEATSQETTLPPADAQSGTTENPGATEKPKDAAPKSPAVKPADLTPEQEMAEQAKELLKLATELKAQLDKTSKDTLSVQVIRKAGEIERLAHNMKKTMQRDGAGN